MATFSNHVWIVFNSYDSNPSNGDYISTSVAGTTDILVSIHSLKFMYNIIFVLLQISQTNTSTLSFKNCFSFLNCEIQLGAPSTHQCNTKQLYSFSFAIYPPPPPLRNLTRQILILTTPCFCRMNSYVHIFECMQICIHTLFFISCNFQVNYYWINEAKIWAKNHTKLYFYEWKCHVAAI